MVFPDQLLKPKRQDKDHRHVESEQRVHGLMKVGAESRLGALGLLLGVRHSSFGISVEQILSVRTVGWSDGVADRDPAGEHAGEPDERGPEGVRQQRDQDLLGGGEGFVREVPVNAHSDGGDDEHHVHHVQVALAVPDGDFQSTPHGSAKLRVSFVEVGFLRAGRGKDCHFAAEPFG